jgi:hypothetical protein
MPWVVLNAQQRAHSIGTAPPGPLPEGWSKVEITAEEWEAVRTGSSRWDDAVGAVVALPVEPDVRADLLAALNAAPLLVDDLRDIVRAALAEGIV